MIMLKNSVMLLFLMPDGTADSVRMVFDFLELGLGLERFQRLFPVILTDNGSEFKKVDDLELNEDLLYRTSLFYCDPMASWQKPHCEKNHEYIRKICPQTTTTFDRLTQKDVNLMMSHINSANRESLGGLTPFTLAKLMLPKKLMKHFGLKEIPSDEIILTPALLKGKIEI